jgi:hypothetical protein
MWLTLKGWERRLHDLKRGYVDISEDLHIGPRCRRHTGSNLPSRQSRQHEDAQLCNPRMDGAQVVMGGLEWVGKDKRGQEGPKDWKQMRGHAPSRG